MIDEKPPSAGSHDSPPDKYAVLDKKQQEVLQRQNENRDKRIEISRKLESMRNSFVDRELKMQELENDMLVLKKRDIVSV